MLFARSATAGGQQLPVHWGGDCESTYASMAESLRGGLSLAMSGFGYWSHDIGGFEGIPDPAVFKRWAGVRAPVLAQPTARLGLVPGAVGVRRGGGRRHPELHAAQAARSCRTWHGSAEEAHRDGIPMMRPMVLEFPHDRGGRGRRHPVHAGRFAARRPGLHGRGRRRVLRPGGDVDEPPRRAPRSRGRGGSRERHGFDSLPLLVRPGTVLPVGARTDRPDYEWADGVTLRLFELPDGHDSTTTVPSETGDPDDVPHAPPGRRGSRSRPATPGRRGPCSSASTSSAPRARAASSCPL